MKDKKILFGKWLSLIMPESWAFETENDLITVYPTLKPKGVLQISCFERNDKEKNFDKFVKEQIDNFINQFNIKIDINSYKIIEGPDYTLANTTGIIDNRFIKIWVIINFNKMFLITYNSEKKTRELSTAENIVYSISIVQ